MTILISFYTVNCTGHNGHLRDELYATLDKEGNSYWQFWILSIQSIAMDIMDT